MKTFIFCLGALLAGGLVQKPLQAQPLPLVVAVIDSGFIAQHPSLEGRLLPGMDMVSGERNRRGGRSANIAPDAWNTQCLNRQPIAGHRTHGTEVASVLVGNGRKGVQGVAPHAQVLPVRAIGACGMQLNDLIDAMAWSAGLPVAGLPDNPHPARVVNISLAGGASVCRPRLQAMVDQLVRQGVFVVAAAGNNFGQALQEPANCRGVVSVGAVDEHLAVADYSALDPRTVVYAYGGTHQKRFWGRTTPRGLRVASVSTQEPGLAGLEQAVAHHGGVGTSFAAPYVSGLIANMLQHQPGLTPKTLLAQLGHHTQAGTPVARCSDCQVRVMAAESVKTAALITEEAGTGVQCLRSALAQTQVDGFDDGLGEVAEHGAVVGLDVNRAGEAGA